ncbi:hypothetical protein [Methanospirillum sp.]
MDHSYQDRADFAYISKHFHPATLFVIDGDRTILRKSVQDHKNSSVEKTYETIRKSKTNTNPAYLMASQF